MIALFNLLGYMLWCIMHPIKAIAATWQRFVWFLFSTAQTLCNGDSNDADGTEHWLDIRGHRLIHVVYHPTYAHEWCEEEGKILNDYIIVLGHKYHHPVMHGAYMDTVFTRSLYASIERKLPNIIMRNGAQLEHVVIDKTRYGMVPAWYAPIAESELVRRGYTVNVFEKEVSVS